MQSNADHYRERAAVCRWRAILRPQERLSWSRLAAQWDDLADKLGSPSDASEARIGSGYPFLPSRPPHREPRLASERGVGVGVG
jgi:hypothetical protein